MALIFGVLVLGLFAAGCGGDDESDGSANGTDAAAVGAQAGGDDAESATDGGEAGEADAGSEGDGTQAAPAGDTEFAAEVTAICNASTKKLTADVRKVLGETSREDSRKVIATELIAEVVAPNLEGQVEEIRALGVPEGDESQVDAYLVAIEETVDRLEASPEKFQNESAPYASAEKAADEYGLTACPLG